MAYTELADLFNVQSYVAGIDQIALYNNVFVNSGIAIPDPRFNVIGQGGSSVKVFGYEPLVEASRNITGVMAASINNITQLSQVGITFNRGVSYGASLIANIKAWGQTPTQAIQNNLGLILAQSRELEMYAVLKGLFGLSTYPTVSGSALGTTLLLDVTPATTTLPADNVAPNLSNFINPYHVIKSMTQKGAVGQKADAIIVHSNVFADMQKQKLLSYNTNVPANVAPQYFSPEIPPDQVPYYTGLRVYVSDEVPVIKISTNYTRYVCFMFNLGAMVTQQQAGLSINYFLNPETYSESVNTLEANMVHVLGTSWTGSVTASPDRTALGTKGNWSLVWDKKHVNVQCLIVSSSFDLVVN